MSLDPSQAPDPAPSETLPTEAAIEDALLAKAESTSRDLCSALDALHSRTLPRGAGPKRLSDTLGVPAPTASRVMKALSEASPLAALHRFPGPAPLRRWVQAAAERASARKELAAALEAIDAFERLIVDEAGDRAALDARLFDSMPEARRTLELRRRQAVFRGLSELEGRSCHLDASILILHPAADGQHVDLCCIQARMGLKNLRPGRATKFVTERLTPSEQDRLPAGLDGRSFLERPLGEGEHRLQLDDFVRSTPTEIEVVRDGDRVQYLVHTPVGEAADLVLAEVNRSEFALGSRAPDDAPFFTHLADTPSRYGALDVVLHPDLVPHSAPQLWLYRNAGEIQARPRDPLRDVDRLEPLDDVERFEGQPERRRLVGLPRYGEMLAHVASQLDWDLSDATTYRVRLEYPVPGTQLTLSFPGAPF